MPEIRAFRAIRYDFPRFKGDLSSIIAPPYDVLDQADKDALLLRDPHNIVAVDLPHIPPKDEGPPQAYREAQRTLASWINEGVLVREDRPALYVYHQTFQHGGADHTRHQLLTALRLHEFSEGIVLPHEQTFGGPKADRLALTKRTRCNLSPVFGLYADPRNQVGDSCRPVSKRLPDAVASLDGVDNKLWVIRDEDVINTVCKLMRPKKVYIADGHHRYTTALNYRNHLREIHRQEMTADHPANFVMVVLASMDDPGCIIQGYCRVLVGEAATADSIARAWSAGADECSPEDADLVLHDGATGSRKNLKFINRQVLDELASDRHPSWRKLDVAYLHTYLIDTLAAEHLRRPPEVRYVKSIEEACRLANQVGGVAVIPRPTPMAQLREVSDAGELMPHKSTFFYPKLATGLTIHPLYADE